MRKILTALMMGASMSFAGPPEAREWKAADGTLVRYRWSAPEAIEAGKTYPLVLFFHGSGERGNDNSAQLKHGVIPIIEGAKNAGSPCFLIAPQCPADRWWAPIERPSMRLSAADKPNPLLEAVLALVVETRKNHPVDPKRFHVTGLSMGGYATWDLLGRASGQIASALPICGGGDPVLASRFKEVPIWAIHGEDDNIVPARTTREMIAALDQAGGKPKVTYYPKTGHDSWTRAYDDPKVIQWLLNPGKP